MIVSESWLRSWISPGLNTEGLVDVLTMAGLEVDSVSPAGPDLPRVVVGRIVGVAPHPRADRLVVCEVHVGRKQPLSVVCGAPNARPGANVPTALAGATLPNGTEIRSSQVRGVKSEAMLCSSSELGLEESAAGLLELDADAAPGEAVAHHLDLSDMVIDIDLTPNRGDCLSVLGIARELAVLTKARLKRTAVPGAPNASAAALAVDLQARAACPHYVARVIEGIDAGARTPDWMRERLRRCGLRSINAVVDVTNYVMLELGQPMHAFDRARISTGLVIRNGRAGEQITLLDGTRASAGSQDLLIADHDKPLALAGVMGGADSAIGDTTRDIVLEAAHFTRAAIQGQARKFGVASDSAFRFERGVDPWLPVAAMHHATVLLNEIAGGRAGKLVAKSSARHLPKRAPIAAGYERITKVLGLQIPPRDIDAILRRVSRGVTRRGNRWAVSPPSYRFDIEAECDVIEEVARVRGYHDLPSRLPESAAAPKLEPEAAVSHKRVKLALVDRGYCEIITYSFVDPGVQRLLDPAAKLITLTNPISEQLSVMRSSLWPGLVQTVAANLRRQHRRIRVFEIGKTFRERGRVIEESLVLGAAICGDARPVHWRSTDRDTDFFDIKGDLEALLALTGQKNRIIFKVLSHPGLHPNQAAEVWLSGQAVGKVGKLHPQALKELDIGSDIYVFQLDWSVFAGGAIPNFRGISKFPSIARDLAVVVNEQTTSHKLMAAIRSAAGKWLAEIRLFDVYRGPSVGEGRKSLAFTLTLRDSSRTLTDNEVESVIAQVTDALGREFGAELRT